MTKVSSKSSLENWSKCKSWIHKKQRYCKFPKLMDSDYCGNHQNNDTILDEKKKRIPCPLDPAHTVRKCDLEKHIVKCNAHKMKVFIESQVYYSKDINSGSLTSCQGELFGSGWNLKLFYKRINDLYENHIGTRIIEVSKLDCLSIKTAVKESVKDGAGKKVLRHLNQQGSIVGNILSKIEAPENHTFIEFGAGKGHLSLRLYEEAPGTKCILVDRMRLKFKCENKLNMVSEDDIIRITADIRHLNIAGVGVPLTPCSSVFGMSKHLCGVATDLTLRCLVRTLRDTQSFSGIAIATCCHHRCLWEDYINPSFFQETLGLDSEAFELMSRFSSWGICGINTEGSRAKRDETMELSPEEKEILGRRCKRLIDLGRMEYLKSQGLQCKLVEYCDLKDSLENVLLLAWRE